MIVMNYDTLYNLFITYLVLIGNIQILYYIIIIQLTFYIDKY